MSDPWSRPDGPVGPRHDQAIEIELDGPGADRVDEPSPRPGPTWRKVVALSSIAGVVIGVIVAAVLIVGGDDDDGDGDDSPPPSIDAADGSTITAPGTLPPVVVETTVPVVTTGGAPDRSPSVIASSPDLPLELPTFPTASLPSDILTRFALDPAELESRVAGRVEVEVSTGDGLGPTLVAIEYDPDTNRYRITIDQRGPVQRMVFDSDRDEIYVMARARDGGDWEVLPAPDVAEDADELYRALLLSPVRPDTLVSAASTSDSAVVLDSGAIARRYTVTLPAIAIPEWTTGATGAAPPGIDHVFEAYVDEGGRLARVQGTVVVDGVRQLIVYRFDHDADVTIDLPELESVDPTVAPFVD